MLQINVKKAAILLFSIMSFVQGQVNIEAMRNTDTDNSNLEIQFDLDFVNTDKKDTEFTYSTKYNYVFDNSATFLGVIKGEYFKQKENGETSEIENKGLLHFRYTHPLSYFYVEGYLQNEFDDLRKLENRQLIGGGVRFDIDNSSFFDSLFIGSGLMYEKEVYNLESLKVQSILKNSNYLTFTKFINEDITYDTTVYLQINTSDIKDYRLLNISTFTFNISQNVGFFLRLDLRDYAKPISDELDYNYTDLSIGVEINL